MRSFLRIIGIPCIGLAAACGHRPANQAEIDQLNRSIEALRVQNRAYAKQVEELENRVFILGDRLESRKVNEQRVETPVLPTVTLHPTLPVPPPVAAAPSGTETAVEPEVEYAGEALKSSARRPLLRLHGDAAEVSIPREPSSQPLTLHVVREGGSRSGKEDSPQAVVLYHRSSEALRKGKHDNAVQGFRDFLRAFPSHDLADNAQYWLGECYYDHKDYTSAVREFRRVIERYPNGNKVPDALLKVGYSYLALGSMEAGRQTLAQLQRSYPRHEAAVLAGTRLAELDRSTPSPALGHDPSSAAPTAKAVRAPVEAP